MAIDLIVLAVSALMAGFFGVWLFFPRLRPWMEAPKYRVLRWPNRCPDAVRPEQKAGDGGTLPGRRSSSVEQNPAGGCGKRT
jgi:hypothetical protein